MCDPWAPPNEDSWDTAEQRKHIGCSKRLYERSIIRGRTAEPRAASQYDPNLSHDYIRELELDCALGKRNEGSGFQAVMLAEHTHTRCFYTKADRVIGYSNGEPTDYVFVVVNCQGRFHGYPITLTELHDRKGFEI
jgi:hypothetical protein